MANISIIINKVKSSSTQKTTTFTDCNPCNESEQTRKCGRIKQVNISVFNLKTCPVIIGRNIIIKQLNRLTVCLIPTWNEYQNISNYNVVWYSKTTDGFYMNTICGNLHLNKLVKWKIITIKVSRYDYYFIFWNAFKKECFNEIFVFYMARLFYNWCNLTKYVCVEIYINTTTLHNRFK